MACGQSGSGETGFARGEGAAHRLYSAANDAYSGEAVIFPFEPAVASIRDTLTSPELLEHTWTNEPKVKIISQPLKYLF
jgi:hypothetical protein